MVGWIEILVPFCPLVLYRMFEYAWEANHVSEANSASVAQKNANASLYSYVKAKKSNILEYVLFCCLLRWINERFT
jgi:hypothetical protein